MMRHIPWAIPRVGPTLPPKDVAKPGDFALAGSGFARFQDVDIWDSTRGVWAESLPAAALVSDCVDLISAKRPNILGLSLHRPRIMGIVNVTPDSFSDGGDRYDPARAVADAAEMAKAGADILDIGGESTRPGAATVAEAEETDRVVPVIEGLRRAGVTTPISVDTRKSIVAEAALVAGANLVNDVSAMTYDPGMVTVVARHAVPVCLMHASGDPATMQQDPRYNHVLFDIFRYLEERIAAAEAGGILRANIIVDPGIGFGKTLEHNMEILRRLSIYHALGVPLLLGVSRKRFIGTLGGAADAKARIPGSVAVGLHGAAHGAHILRVHDVAETRQALQLWQALNGQEVGKHDEEP